MMMTRCKISTKSPKIPRRSNCNKSGEKQKKMVTVTHQLTMATPSSLLADSIAARLKVSRRKCVQQTPPQPWWVLRRTVAKAPQKLQQTKTPPTKTVTQRSKSSSGKRKKTNNGGIGLNGGMGSARREVVTVTPCTTRKMQQRKENNTKSSSTIRASKISKRSQQGRTPLFDTPLTRKRATEKLVKEVLEKEKPKIVTTRVRRNDQNSADDSLVKFIQSYKVQRKNVLGSGQFGTVYAGIHRQSGLNVAIKAIPKGTDLYSIFNVDTLRNEFVLLQKLDHPCIIKFHMLSESKEEVFAAMERMDGDMLELILTQPNGRMKERTAKFLLRQILCAVRYLHSRGIAHCDLKPENILLSTMDSGSEFAHAKLCDFGYARVITGPQLRRSLVGTPAYLAPEVTARTGYNKMLDMWSLGVIIYVTLSGTFPFNEAEQITEACLEPESLFPANPWKEVAPEAVDLIQKLLKMNMDERLMVEQCIDHQWLQNALTYSDLLSLEQRLGLAQRFITSEPEDRRWAPELRTMGLRVPTPNRPKRK